MESKLVGAPILSVILIPLPTLQGSPPSLSQNKEGSWWHGLVRRHWKLSQNNLHSRENVGGRESLVKRE